MNSSQIQSQLSIPPQLYNIIINPLIKIYIIMFMFMYGWWNRYYYYYYLHQMQLLTREVSEAPLHDPHAVHVDWFSSPQTFGHCTNKQNTHNPNTYKRAVGHIIWVGFSFHGNLPINFNPQDCFVILFSPCNVFCL